MKHSGLLLSLFFFTITGLKATQVTDSLENLLRTTTDTNRVKLLSDLCWEYRFVSADKALDYGNQALDLSKKLRYKKGIAQAFNDMGIIYIDRGNYTEALDFFNSAMKIRTALNDSSGIASLYNKIGIVYQKQDKLKEALENQIEALKIYEALKQDLWIGYCLNNIAIIHQNLGDLDKSLEYHNKALEYRIKMGDEYGEAGSYGNIANVYVKQGDSALAVKYYEKALVTFRKIKNDEGTSAMLSNLGNIYLARNQNEKALHLLDESLKLREKLGDKKGISSSLIKIGEAYSNQGKYNLAKSNLFRAFEISREIGVLEEEVAAYLVIAKMYALDKKPDSAYDYIQTYIRLKDSLYNIQLNQQIVEVQTKYETDKIEQEKELFASKYALTKSQLKQRKAEIWLLISTIISISGATIFLLYRRRQKQKEALDAAVIKHNEEQLKAVLAGQEEERQRIARELHDGVGQTLAGIKLNWEGISDKFNTTGKNDNIRKLSSLLNEVSSEVRTISHQMMPKELEHFGLLPALENMLNNTLVNTKIKYSFEHFGLENRLPADIELSLFRISQELVSNVIKHAKADKIDLQVMRRKESLVYVFSDDGRGMDLKSEKKTGIGMINIESRVQSFKGKLNVESNNGEGTTFTIRVPL
jgi:two-component system, NarL family, sensor kinase